MIELHFAGYQPPRSVHTRALHALREGLAALCPDALRLKVTDSVVPLGHRAADLLTMVESGELDGCYFASSYLADRVPGLSVFDLPFQVGSRDAVFAGLDGHHGAALGQEVAETTGLQVLGWWDNGIRHISNAVRPIHVPEDCRGLRLRTLDNAQHQAAFRRLGFEPIFLDVADLPGAVAQGSVDAQENPLTNLINFDIHRYHRHVSLTGHLLGIAPLLMNRARYQALAHELQASLQAVAIGSAALQRRLASGEDAGCANVLADAGVALVESRAIYLAGFRAAACRN